MCNGRKSRPVFSRNTRTISNPAGSLSPKWHHSRVAGSDRINATVADPGKLVWMSSSPDCSLASSWNVVSCYAKASSTRFMWRGQPPNFSNASARVRLTATLRISVRRPAVFSCLWIAITWSHWSTAYGMLPVLIEKTP